MKCGLLGRKLGHSYSPQIHNYLGKYSYVLFEKEPEDLEDFLRSSDFTGINVTIPYKKDVIPFLDELSPIAKKMGAVNTIVRRSDGTLFGHNTDYFGFASMIQKSELQVTGKKVLVLGSGGASNTVVAVLRELEANVVVISRSGDNNYNNLHIHADAAVIVNTTPVGMYPKTGVSPVNLKLFPKLEGVLDVIYNPARTQLLMDAEKLNITYLNGLWMLVAQAKEAAEYFTGSEIDDSVITEIYNRLSSQTQNIVLIGMPGCGKSTIAALLADKLNRSCQDADSRIEELAGKPIPHIFSDDGEEVFRELETQALASLGKESGVVIATGGGCVTKARNYSLLHQNGQIFWLKRPLELLPTDGRPLSQKNKLTDLYAIRQPLYESFADHIIDNTDAPEKTADAIIKILEETP